MSKEKSTQFWKSQTKGNNNPVKYMVKVEISVYEMTDDMEDVFRVEVRAKSTDENAAVSFAKDAHTNVLTMLTERMK